MNYKYFVGGAGCGAIVASMLIWTTSIQTAAMNRSGSSARTRPPENRPSLKSDSTRLTTSGPSSSDALPPSPRDALAGLSRAKTFPRQNLELEEDQYKRAVQRDYGFILESLGLSPGVTRELKNLLKERRRAWSDVNDAESHASSRDIAADRKVAETEIDGKIKILIDPISYSKVQQMLSSSLFVHNLQESFIPQAAFAGSPLSADQLLHLAGVMTNYYDRFQHPERREAVLHEPVSVETGLTGTDERVLNEVSDFMSPLQSKLLRQSFLVSNQSSLTKSPPKATK